MKFFSEQDKQCMWFSTKLFPAFCVLALSHPPQSCVFRTAHSASVLKTKGQPSTLQMSPTTVPGKFHLQGQPARHFKPWLCQQILHCKCFAEPGTKLLICTIQMLIDSTQSRIMSYFALSHKPEELPWHLLSYVQEASPISSHPLVRMLWSGYRKTVSTPFD